MKYIDWLVFWIFAVSQGLLIDIVSYFRPSDYCWWAALTTASLPFGYISGMNVLSTEWDVQGK